MGYRKPDPNKYVLDERPFSVDQFRIALKRCVQFIYKTGLDKRGREFSYLAKQILNGLLEIELGKSPTARWDELLVKLIEHLETAGSYQIGSSEGIPFSIEILEPITKVHAETLRAYVNHRREISSFSSSIFNRPLLHDRCKWCKRTIVLSRRNHLFCNTKCYRKYKGKTYFRKKAKQPK